MAISPYAFVTLVSSDYYLPGALTLAAALKEVHPSPPVPPEVQFQVVCLVTPETVDVSTIKLLRKAFDVVIGVEVIVQNDQKGLDLLGRPDLNTVLTKLHVFRLTQFSKIVFLDADVLPVRPLSHLFSIAHEFSAAPDVGWPDIFNSGVMVLSPGEDKFAELNSLLKSRGSWDGGDQGILNEWRGQNWNRISFTYNTTPTAAYTYAPAYERFGSSIKAIHFIGPNKPWSQIASRAPARAVPESSKEVQNKAYDYQALLDRWFSVYDRHYRANSVPAAMEFGVQKYIAAWDQHQTNSADGSSGVGYQASNSTYGLDELRALALHGVSAATFAADSHVGEGIYQSIPLEGRVHLMRPLQSPPSGASQINYVAAGAQTAALASSIPTHINLPPRFPPGYNEGLPTPAPHEIPPAPQLRPMSLVSTPSPQLLRQSSYIQLAPASQDFPQAPAQNPQLEQPEQHSAHANHSLDPTLSQTQLAPPDSSSPNQPPSVLSLGLRGLAEFQQPTPQHQDNGSDSLALDTSSILSPRPPSPPLLEWNPAVDPPPTTAPLKSAFPSETYFPNVWDKPLSKVHDRPRELAAPSSPPAASSLFNPLPMSPIPESLRRQGHYRNVTGESSDASPDPSKVKPVFPWEDKPRHAPGRAFPESEKPPASLFIESGSTTEDSSIASPSPPPPHSQLISSPSNALSPLGASLNSLTFVNAWDTDPGIQHYATRLMGPPKLSQPLDAPFDEKEWQRIRDDRWEEGSRDGDDEDEGDDETGDEGRPTSYGVDRSDGLRSQGRTPTMNRRTSDVSEFFTLKGITKTYRIRGVQTIPKELRDMGIQVTTPTINTPLALPDSQKDRMEAQAPAANVLSPDTKTLQGNGTKGHLPSEQGTGSPDTVGTAPPVGTSPSRASPLLLSHLQSESSNASSPASIGPLSPPDGFSPLGLSGTRRSSGRIFDPARGVDVFKKGSEQVLARFLKMGSWDDAPPATR